MRTPLFMTLALLVACGDKDPEDDDTGTTGTTEDGGTIACGSTQGFVYGEVNGPWSEEPNPYARVYAEAMGMKRVDAELAGDGSYELNLEGGYTWHVTATDEGCVSPPKPVDVEECEEYELDIHIPSCTTADKPNLYLYPLVDTETHVTLRTTDRQRIVASDPAYPAQGWQGVAHTDGTFSVDARRAPFLFYEVSLAPWQDRRMQRDQGWCLPQASAHRAMADILGAYGFDAVEREDFVEAWEHDLPPSPDGYAVYPQLAVEHAAAVDISPALPLERLWLVVEDGAGCTARAPHVVPFGRRGAHAVEWGVVLSGLVR